MRKLGCLFDSVDHNCLNWIFWLNFLKIIKTTYECDFFFFLRCMISSSNPITTLPNLLSLFEIPMQSHLSLNLSRSCTFIVFHSLLYIVLLVVQFPSMASLQGVLPNVPPPSGLVRTSSLGTPSSAWMPPQSLPYASGMPLQSQPYASAVPQSKVF